MDQVKKTKTELLHDKDEKMVIKTIQKIRDTGKNDDLPILAALYKNQETPAIKDEINHFFCDLRNQESVETMVRLISTMDDKPTLKMLTASAWQSRLNYVDHFELFIDLVIHEPFEIAFEAFTLMESFEEKTTAARIESLTAYVQSKIKKCQEENMPFAKDLPAIISSFKI